MNDNEMALVFYALEKDAKYALNSHSRNLVYQTFGAAKMAIQLGYTLAEMDQRKAG